MPQVQLTDEGSGSDDTDSEGNSDGEDEEEDGSVEEESGNGNGDEDDEEYEDGPSAGTVIVKADCGKFFRAFFIFLFVQIYGFCYGQTSGIATTLRPHRHNNCFTVLTVSCPLTLFVFTITQTSRWAR